MTIANVTRENGRGLSTEMRAAQEAIHLPEVQEMLHRLSHHGLGIYMPHMHDEHSGEFQPLPDDVMQVESGLNVSFKPTGETVSHTTRFLPVGWRWSAGAPTPSTVCEMASDEGQSDTSRNEKHTKVTKT